MKRVKAAVIGTGFIGPVHIDALRRLGYVDIVAISDYSDAAAAEKARQLCIERAYGDYRAMLAEPDIEVVHIATPNKLHFAMAKAALLAGKHVVCEKPLAFTVAEGRELLEIARQTGLVNAVNFNMRFYPLVHQAREMVKAGELGDILSVSGGFYQDWLLKDTDYSWRVEKEQSGESRAVADIGSHWMDMAQFITGKAVKAVCADFATIHPVRKKPKKPVETFSGKILSNEDYDEKIVTTEDYASVLLRMEGNAHGSYTVMQAAAGKKAQLSIEVFGSKASIGFNTERPNEMWIGLRDEANRLLVRDPALMHESARKICTLPGGHNEGYPDTVRQMFGKIYGYICNGGAVEFPTFADGVHELELCDCIVRSAKADKWLSV